MSLELAIAENTAAIRELIARVTDLTNALQVSTVEVEVAKEKRQSKKAELIADAKPAKHGPAAESVAEPVVETADEPVTVTLQDITNVVLALGKAGKRDGLVKLLGEYGVPKASALPGEVWPEFLKKANALLGV